MSMLLNQKQIATDQSRGLEMPNLKEVGFCVQIEIVYT